MSETTTVRSPNWVGYRMPEVRVGDIVLWYPDAQQNAQPSAAVVTAVAQDHINCAVIVPDGVVLQPRDAVRHLSDPQLRITENRENGGWDFTPLHRDVKQLMHSAKSSPGGKS